MLQPGGLRVRRNASKGAAPGRAGNMMNNPLGVRQK